VFRSRVTVGTYTHVDAGTSDMVTGGGDSNSTQALGGDSTHGSRSTDTSTTGAVEGGSSSDVLQGMNDTSTVEGGSGSDGLQGMNGTYDSWRLQCVQFSCDCWNVH